MRQGYLPRLLLSFAALGVTVLLLVLWVTPKTDISFVFPRNPSPDIELLVERLQQGPSAGILLLSLAGAGPEPLPAESIVVLSNRLARALDESGRFRFVANGQTRPPGPEVAALFEKRYLLNPPLSAGDFGVVALRAAFERTLEDLHSSFGAVGKRLLPSDPTGRLRDVLEFWQGGSRGTGAGGHWLSDDQAAAFLMVQSRGAAYDLGPQQETLDFIQQSFEAARAEVPAHLEMTGPIVFATQSRQIIQAEMKSLTVLSSLFVIALLYWAFRSLVLMLAMILPLGFGLCAGALAVQAVFGEIHGITIAFGGTLIGIAVDYPIHVISHRTGEDGARAALKNIWPTLRLGMLTSVAAFFAFTLSSFQGLAQLGLFAMIGLLAAALITRFVLPAVLPPTESRPLSRRWRGFRLPAPQVRTLRLFLLALLVPAIAQIVAQRASLWEKDLRNLSLIPQAARDLDRRLRSQMGATDVRYLLVVRKPSIEEVLQYSESLAPELQAMVDRGQAASFDMAARYLPSQQSQEQRRAVLPGQTDLAQAVETATAGLPFQPGLFKPFLEGVAKSKLGPTVQREDFETAGIAWLLEALLFQQAGDWVGLIAPQGLADPKALMELVARQKDETLSFLDLKTGSQELVADYRREALIWLAVGALFAVMMLLVGLRSPARVARVMAPVLLAIPLTLSVLSLSGTALSLFHLLSLLLVAGVGLDYALFFDRYARQAEDWPRTLRANVLCAMTTVTVFSILAFSRIPILQGLGETVAIGALFALIFAYLFFLPARASSA